MGRVRGVGGMSEGVWVGCVVQGSDRGRKHAVQKGVCVHVCVWGGEGGEGVIERERGGEEGEGRCRAGEVSVCVERIWRGGRRRRVCVFTKSGGEMGGEKSVVQRKTGLLTSR